MLWRPGNFTSTPWPRWTPACLFLPVSWLANASQDRTILLILSTAELTPNCAVLLRNGTLYSMAQHRGLAHGRHARPLVTTSAECCARRLGDHFTALQ